MKLSDKKYNQLINTYHKFSSKLRELGKHFGGPSIYFHKRALEERNKDFLSNTHLEMIYATLASWGMHRMGKTLTKLVAFEKFEDSILKQKNNLLELKDLKIENPNEFNDKLIEELTDLCFSFEVSESNSKIVANSKTLAHILPDLCPPIDRKYTINFFTEGAGPPNLNNNEYKQQKEIFKYVLKKTFDFANKIKSDKDIPIDKEFNTSYPKIFDNFIIIYMQIYMQEERNKNGKK